MFDNGWADDPHSNQIHELIGFQQQLAGGLENYSG